MAARGRLYNQKNNEGGADAAYDGAFQSDFHKTPNKSSAQFAQAAPRFKENISSAPDVDVPVNGIGATATKKGPAPNFSSAKPRFAEATPQGVGAGDYEVAKSDFAQVKATPSPMMRTPDRHKERAAGWIKNDEQINTPAPNDPLPGAFDASLAKNKPSPFTSSTGARFKDNHVEMNSEPAQPLQSDFERAINNARPSPSTMSGSSRFKVQESAGDPGSMRTASDIDRERLEAKIARQRQQAEAEAARALNQYQ